MWILDNKETNPPQLSALPAPGTAPGSRRAFGSFCQGCWGRFSLETSLDKSELQGTPPQKFQFIPREIALLMPVLLQRDGSDLKSPNAGPA